MAKRRFWFATKDKFLPADYEAWFESLAAEGWNIDKLNPFNAVSMTFERTEPKNYRYVFDFKAGRKQQYIDERQREGWEHVGHLNGYFVWRKEYAGERHETFVNDADVLTALLKIKHRVKRPARIFLVSYIYNSIMLLIDLFRASADTFDTDFIIRLALLGLCGISVTYDKLKLRRAVRALDKLYNSHRT